MLFNRRQSSRVQNKHNGFKVTKATAEIVHAVEKVDWIQTMRLIQANSTKVCTKMNPREVSPGCNELYLTGEKKSYVVNWLRKQENPCDEHKLIGNALDHLISVAENHSKMILQTPKFDWNSSQIASAKFSNHSILSRIDTDRPCIPQPPHIDVNKNTAQFLIALTPNCRPVEVFNDEILNLDCELIDTAKIPLGLPREKLEILLVPSSNELLSIGDTVTMMGPLIHRSHAQISISYQFLYIGDQQPIWERIEFYYFSHAVKREVAMIKSINARRGINNAVIFI